MESWRSRYRLIASALIALGPRPSAWKANRPVSGRGQGRQPPKAVARRANFEAGRSPGYLTAQLLRCWGRFLTAGATWGHRAALPQGNSLPFVPEFIMAEFESGRPNHGFDKTSAAELRRRLTPLIRKTQRYSERIAHKVFWVEPKLLAEIEYRAKSASSKVRHPFFKGLREDHER
jgi:hypothetical protein